MYEGSYFCPACGEEIVVPVDPQEDEQTYVEDCPVCCRPNELTVRTDGRGGVTIGSTRSDR